MGKIDTVPIERLIWLIKLAIQDRWTVYTFGNGGSSSTASHFAGDLAKSCGCKTMCLNDSMVAFSAWANDIDYPSVFSKQLEPIVKMNDLVIGISGSGNSLNVIKGIEMAKTKHALTVGMTAFNGGKLKDLVDLAIVVPIYNIEQAEDAHLMIWHIIKTCIIKQRICNELSKTQS
jgi:D-sedoheptulose 7-phosphate isomerase